MPRRVIIADDEDVFRGSHRRVVETYARDSGIQIEVHEVNNGSDLIQRVRGGLYDLVFTDYNMPPGPTGVEAIKQIRGFNGNVPIYVVSSHDAHSPVAQEASRVGATGYIDKVSRTTNDELRKALETHVRPEQA